MGGIYTKYSLREHKEELQKLIAAQTVRLDTISKLLVTDTEVLKESEEKLDSLIKKSLYTTGILRVSINDLKKEIHSQTYAKSQVENTIALLSKHKYNLKFEPLKVVEALYEIYKERKETLEK